MTFTEAALEVLRSVGEPLHYKKITELAIERNLLSHVGKTPEVTMSSRLAMMVKKDRGSAPIIKVKPGVFAIRESALQGANLSPEALAAISEVEGIEEAKPTSEASATEEEAVVVPTKAPLLPGSDVFPEEEGDDDPILAGLEQEGDAGERSGRRRRRRRRRKGEKPEGAVEASPRGDNGQRESSNGRERFRERSRPERFERQHSQNHRSEERRATERSEETNLDWNRQPADGDLLGKDLADAVCSVLARGDRVPHTFTRVAELLVRRGRLSGTPAALAPTIAAAVRADMARAELQRARPRFRLCAGRLSLSEWQQSKGLQRAEQELLASAERYGNELRRALIQKLGELPTAGFAELVATWLNAEGVTALRAVRRPGSSGSELHFAGTRKTGSEEVRLAIVVQRGGRDIDREAVVDVRGALHHYGQAQAAWVITLGRITSGAREEAAAQAAACALFDGNALASAMERLGVAMRRNVIAHHEIDFDLLESLGDNPEQRERREREQEREQRERRERSREGQEGQQRARGGRRGGRSAAPAVDEAESSEAGDAYAQAAQAAQTVQTVQTVIEQPPVRLRDADWDDDTGEHAGVPQAQRDEDEVADVEADAVAGASQADEFPNLRDELEAADDDDSDEAAEEEFSTVEDADEEILSQRANFEVDDRDDVDDVTDDFDDPQDSDDADDADDADDSDESDDADDLDDDADDLDDDVDDRADVDEVDSDDDDQDDDQDEDEDNDTDSDTDEDTADEEEQPSVRGRRR